MTNEQLNKRHAELKTVALQDHSETIKALIAKHPQLAALSLDDLAGYVASLAIKAAA